MPIYKMEGKKDGLQKYRDRINYKDSDGKDRQTDRVAYGMEAAKMLERQLAREKKEAPDTPKTLTVQELYDEYIAMKKYKVRESSLAKTETVLNNHVLPLLKYKNYHS